MTVCSDNVMYAYQSKSSLYSCLNVKKLLDRKRLEFWNLSNCNGARTHNHLVCKWKLNHWMFVYEISGCGFESRCSQLIFIFFGYCIMLKIWIYPIIANFYFSFNVFIIIHWFAIKFFFNWALILFYISECFFKYFFIIN